MMKKTWLLSIFAVICSMLIAQPAAAKTICNAYKAEEKCPKSCAWTGEDCIDIKGSSCKYLDADNCKGHQHGFGGDLCSLHDGKCVTSCASSGHTKESCEESGRCKFTGREGKGTCRKKKVKKEDEGSEAGSETEGHHKKIAEESE